MMRWLSGEGESLYSTKKHKSDRKGNSKSINTLQLRFLSHAQPMPRNWAIKKYRGHRVLPESIMQDFDNTVTTRSSTPTD